MTDLDLAPIEARDANATLDSLFPGKSDRRALLAEVKRLRARLTAIGALFAGGPDTSCRTTWPDDGYGGHTECVEVPMEDLRAALNPTSEDTP